MFDIDKEMLTESSDFNITKIKTSEEFAQDEIKSARNGIGGFLIAGFAVGRTLMVFSRKPGSAGIYMLVAWCAGVAVQGFWFFGHVEKYGRIDATPYEALIAIQMVWWLPGLLMTLWRLFRRRHVPDGDPGIGIFNRFFYRAGRHRADLISDLMTGSLLAGLFHLLKSPVQAKFYLVVMGWIVVCYAFYYAQQVSYRLRADAARRRAGNWPQNVRGVHKL